MSAATGGRWLRGVVLGGVGAVVLAVLAGACGSDGTLAEPDTPQETVGKDRTVDTRVEEMIHLDYWHGYVLNMAWSPDDSRILITGNTDSDRYENWNRVEDWNIFLVDVDGSNLVQLTDWPGAEQVDWFPDGSRMLISGLISVVESLIPGVESSGVYEVDVDELDWVQLTDWPDYIGSFPYFILRSWSPDGSRVLVYSLVGGGPIEHATRDIYVVGADWSDWIRLTDWPGNEWGSWSPDGSQILIHSEPGNFWDGYEEERDVYVVDVDGSNMVQLTDWPGYEWGRWSPDGSLIEISGNPDNADGDEDDVFVIRVFSR